jgi:hypothetical protein
MDRGGTPRLRSTRVRRPAKCLETHCGHTCSRLLAGFPQKMHDLDMRQKATDPLRRWQAAGRPRRIMRGMQLPRSRTALRQATQAVEELRAAKDSPDLFRDRFVSTLGMVQRVGSIIDQETKGHRTPEFGKWWTKTGADPLFMFMQDVRNAEFKRGERRQRATHYGKAKLHIQMEGRVRESRQLSDPPSPSSGPPSPKPHTTATKSSDWYFMGGQYGGQEIFTLLDGYIAWLRDDILPTAERLTR